MCSLFGGECHHIGHGEAVANGLIFIGGAGSEACDGCTHLSAVDCGIYRGPVGCALGTIAELQSGEVALEDSAINGCVRSIHIIHIDSYCSHRSIGNLQMHFIQSHLIHHVGSRESDVEIAFRQLIEHLLRKRDFCYSIIIG